MKRFIRSRFSDRNFSTLLVLHYAIPPRRRNNRLILVYTDGLIHIRIYTHSIIFMLQYQIPNSSLLSRSDVEKITYSIGYYIFLHTMIHPFQVILRFHQSSPRMLQNRLLVIRTLPWLSPLSPFVAPDQILLVSRTQIEPIRSI